MRLEGADGGDRMASGTGYSKMETVVPNPKRVVNTRTAVEKEVGPLPKYGEKCRHGYMNWMVCPDCNPKSV